jgi:hypothetical protein
MRCNLKGQQLLVEMNYVPTSKRAESPLKNVPLKLVDPVTLLDEADKWTKLHGDLTVRQGKKPGIINSENRLNCLQNSALAASHSR